MQGQWCAGPYRVVDGCGAGDDVQLVRIALACRSCTSIVAINPHLAINRLQSVAAHPPISRSSFTSSKSLTLTAFDISPRPRCQPTRESAQGTNTGTRRINQWARGPSNVAGGACEGKSAVPTNHVDKRLLRFLDVVHKHFWRRLRDLEVRSIFRWVLNRMPSCWWPTIDIIERRPKLLYLVNAVFNVSQDSKFAKFQTRCSQQFLFVMLHRKNSM